MKSFASTTVLLCSISVLHVLGSESWSVEVHCGQSAIMLCSNYTSSPMSISWFRAVRRSTLRRILNINSPSKPVSSEDQRFTATSNLSHIFLTIKPVNTLDTGLYLCGYDSTLGLVIKGSTYLDVQVVQSDSKYLLWLLLIPVVMVMASVLLVLIGRRHKSAQNDNETNVNSSKDNKEYENYRLAVVRESADDTYQSLCVDTMDPNQIYSSI